MYIGIFFSEKKYTGKNIQVSPRSGEKNIQVKYTVFAAKRRKNIQVQIYSSRCESANKSTDKINSFRREAAKKIYR